MGVIVKSREYQNIFRPTDTGINWLIGNVGVWQKLTLECEFNVSINFDTINALFLDDPNVLTLSSGKSWNDYGFAEGDEIVIEWIYQDITQNPPVDYFNRVPTNLNNPIFIGRLDGSKAFLIDSTGNDITTFGTYSNNILPTQSGSFKIKNVVVYTDKQPTGINFTYGHINNNSYQNQNLSSFIDGSVTQFFAQDTDQLNFGDSLQMIPFGFQSGMSVSFCNLKYVTKQGFNYYYEIEICFMISSFFDDITTFQTNVSPPVTFDAASLTDNFKVIGYPVYNNPNIKIQNELNSTAKLGNTGWFDENFNGFQNNFSVSSVIYENAAGTIVSSLDHNNPITVTAIIDGVPNVTGQSRCSYGFMWIPIDDNVYKSNDFPFYENVKMNTGGDADNFGDVFNVQLFNSPDATIRQGYSIDNSKMNVQNVLFERTGVNQITFSADFIPTPEFSAQFDALDITERNFILWVSVADRTEQTNKSDRVSLLLDFNQLDTFIEPVGEFEGLSIEFLDHTQDENSVSSGCGVDMRIEDDILSRVFFQIDTAQGSDIPVPTALSYGVVFERISDGFQYSLDNYQIDLTQFPNPSQINFSSSQGFKLISGQNKNFIKIERFPSLDVGSLLGFRGLYGFKIRWEDWILRLNIPDTIKADIFDNQEKQNGLNNDWYNYLDTAGYNIYFVVNIDAVLNGNSVRYQNKKNMLFKDYDQNPDITTEFRYYRDSDNTLLTAGTDPLTGLPLGVILNNELVRLEIEYTRTSGTWTNINDVYGLNCIEVDGGGGQKQFRQLSSVVLPESDNPLTPLPSDTLLDIQIISPTILRCTCLIDPNKLISAERYKVTGRQGCKI
jgi:hypothetical protein